MSLTSSQCRAARALLGWSQDDLEAKSKVSKKSIAEFEREVQIPYERTLRELALAFEAGGVQLIAQNGGGAGVRLKAAVPQLMRKRVSRFDRVATIAIGYRGREYQLRLSTDILDDMDRTNHPSDAEFEKSIDSHMNLILITAAAAVDAGRAQQDGVVLLTNADFEEETSPRRRSTSSTRFVLGQRYISKRAPHKIAQIVQLADDGRKAWVDVHAAERSQLGPLLDSAWADFAVFVTNWTLI